MVIKTRDRLIEVARKLFLNKGIENTTMIDIANASDNGRRTVYSYFKIKVISIVLLLSEKAKIMLKPLKKLQRKIYLRATNLKSLSTNGSTLSLKPLSKKNLFCLG